MSFNIQKKNCLFLSDSAAECPDPGNVAFSTRKLYQESYRLGAQVKYTCDFNGASTTITCQSDSTWSETPTCPGLCVCVCVCVCVVHTLFIAVCGPDCPTVHQQKMTLPHKLPPPGTPGSPWPLSV